MTGVNRLTLLGNLCKDPEYKEGKAPYVKLIVATNEKFKNKDGMYEERPTYHRVTLFNGAAKYAREKAKKGNKVYIEAHLQNNKWTDKDGKTNYSVEIICEQFELLTRNIISNSMDSVNNTGFPSLESRPDFDDDIGF